MYEVWIFFVGVSFYPAGLAQYFFPEKQKYKIFSFGCYIFYSFEGILGDPKKSRYIALVTYTHTLMSHLL